MSGAVYDSNGTISTGNTSITGTSSGTFESAASWIGVLRDGSVQANAGHAAASVSSNAADPSTASSSGAPAVVFPSAVAGQSVAKVSARAGHASISVVANAVAEDNPGFGPAGSVAVQAVANDAAVVTSQLGIGQASVSVQGNPPVSFVGARVVWSVSNAPSGVNAQAGHAAVRVHSLE